MTFALNGLGVNLILICAIGSDLISYLDLVDLNGNLIIWILLGVMGFLFGLHSGGSRLHFCIKHKF